MGARNEVIAGNYKGRHVGKYGNEIYLYLNGNEDIKLNKSTVLNYEVIDSENRKSAVSAVGRATVGAVLLGPVGIVAGFSAKRKGIYTVAIEFHDGNKSLIEMDEKRYKIFMETMF